ncbi:unnamed protein product [Vitrella brassicaformis CCMP3155]|uniref:Uncharacterized protein n=1 Tax=Vitrella brassicaformis (strain CCMP3155) TaxID=1169540 RepID=A0A0G4GR79_VITBC|nr:unnamed protein product [Vitrella brassicaformis CCMP3155]|eukprot:CEM33011.1 unnamed protein product [Vitrella brassicaformis CCMP3155]
MQAPLCQTPDEGEREEERDKDNTGLGDNEEAPCTTRLATSEEEAVAPTAREEPVQRLTSLPFPDPAFAAQVEPILSSLKAIRENIGSWRRTSLPMTSPSSPVYPKLNEETPQHMMLTERTYRSNLPRSPLARSPNRGGPVQQSIAGTETGDAKEGGGAVLKFRLPEHSDCELHMMGTEDNAKQQEESNDDEQEEQADGEKAKKGSSGKKLAVKVPALSLGESAGKCLPVRLTAPTKFYIGTPEVNSPDGLLVSPSNEVEAPEEMPNMKKKQRKHNKMPLLMFLLQPLVTLYRWLNALPLITQLLIAAVALPLLPAALISFIPLLVVLLTCATGAMWALVGVWVALAIITMAVRPAEVTWEVLPHIMAWLNEQGLKSKRGRGWSGAFSSGQEEGADD